MGQEEGKRSHFLVVWELGHTGCPTSSRHPDEGGRGMEQDHESGPELIESRQTGGRSLNEEGRVLLRSPLATQPSGLQPGVDMDPPGCSHHATGEGSVPPPPHPSPPGGAKFTRMIQQQLLILQPPTSLLSLLLIWRRWESLPQNLGHFLMTCQGRMWQRRMKRRGGGGASSLQPGSGVRSRSSERASPCHPVSLKAL